MTTQSGQPAPRRLAGKYLTFTLAEQAYGVPIQRVREITALAPITPVPDTPPFILGVFNLRGKILPVMDLRYKFKLNSGPATRLTCIVLVEMVEGDTRTPMGLLVDSVSDVVDIPESEVTPAPSFGPGSSTELLAGISSSAGGVKLLLDVDKLLTASELSAARVAGDKDVTVEVKS